MYDISVMSYLLDKMQPSIRVTLTNDDLIMESEQGFEPTFGLLTKNIDYEATTLPSELSSFDQNNTNTKYGKYIPAVCAPLHYKKSTCHQVHCFKRQIKFGKD